MRKKRKKREGLLTVCTTCCWENLKKINQQTFGRTVYQDENSRKMKLHNLECQKVRYLFTLPSNWKIVVRFFLSNSRAWVYLLQVVKSKLPCFFGTPCDQLANTPSNVTVGMWYTGRTKLTASHCKRQNLHLKNLVFLREVNKTQNF